ncbi:MAG TPA: glycosyltransferase family 9 protein [Terracidiphilus sp.]
MLRFLERGIRGKALTNVHDLNRLRHFLFLEYGTALGSNVHASPLYEALKCAVPDAVTMVACSRMAFEVLQNNPFIDYLVETRRPTENTGAAIRCLRGHLKDTGFVPEVIITSKGNEQRSIALLSLFLGKATRMGYTGAPEFYDVLLQPDREESLIDNNLRVVERLGYPSIAVEPRVSFSLEDLQKARGLLDRASWNDATPRVVFITQTSPTQRKSWPRGRFVSVINHTLNVHGARAIFVGTASESENIESIRADVQGESINLAGQTTIPHLAALLSLCDYAVSLDTGNMHIARSVGLPMVILAPAWQPAIEWLPLGFDQYRIFKGADIPHATPNYVMDEIGVDEVIAALDDLFERYPSSQQSRGERVARGMAHVSTQSRRRLPQ